MENVNKSLGGSCVKYRVQPPGVAPAAIALRKQEIIQELDAKEGCNSGSYAHFSDSFLSYRVKTEPS